MLKLYVTDSLYLNAEETGEATWTIHLSNGEKIEVAENPKYNGDTWLWKINGTVWSREDWALDYLKRIVTESLTGNQIISHEKREVPDIYDVNDAACLKTYITDSRYLNAEQTGEKTWTIHLSNGGEIEVEEAPVYNGNIWAWKINGSIWSREDWALGYLKRIIAEKLTGKRILFHAKREVPDICGVNGAACRCKGECNSALCSWCPIAEKFFADRDGVELIYAV